MRVWLSTVVLLLTGVFAAPELAAQGKLYKWTDKDGNVFYSDQVPPDAAKEAREELNKQGLTVKRVERAMTTEERAAWELEQARLAEERKLAADRERQDEILRSAYATEADLVRSYQERFNQLDQMIESAGASVQSQQKSLADMLQLAADFEQSGRPIGAKLGDSITSVRRQVLELETHLARRQNERIALQAALDDTIARYRELKQAAEGP